MDSLIVRYAFLRFFGTALVVLACWNFHLLRLLNGWSATDLVHVGLGIGGTFFLGWLVLWRARTLWRETPTEFDPAIESTHRTLNALFLVFLLAIAVGDMLTVGDFFTSAKLVTDGSIAEAAYVARDVAIARIGAFGLLSIYLGIGIRRPRVNREPKSGPTGAE